MSYLGSWKIDDYLTFPAITTKFDTGVATDADAVPAYRIYEDETTTPIVTGDMALLDAANTAGLYSERVQLTAASGFEKGKCYTIHIAATVNSVAGATCHTFQVEAEVDANALNPASIVASVSGNVDGSVASVTGAVGSVTGAVGSVTGAVGSVAGNVDGSVASVVGAVGSVTGAVGSVTGAVGSVAGNVDGVVTLANGAHGGAAAAFTLADYSDFTGGVTAAGVVTALKASTGYTVGGTMTFAEVVQTIVSATSGQMQLKSGETDVYEVLDAEDGTTVIAEVTLAESTPYRSVSIL